MRFKVDQNLPIEIADALRTAGHEAETVYDEHLAGTPDSLIGQMIQREHRALVTLDLGFGDVRGYPPAEYFGIIVLRPSKQDRPTILTVFDRVLPLLEREPLRGRLWIVTDRRIRVRD